mgnify:FL=1
MLPRRSVANVDYVTQISHPIIDQFFDGYSIDMLAIGLRLLQIITCDGCPHTRTQKSISVTANLL